MYSFFVSSTIVDNFIMQQRLWQWFVKQIFLEGVFMDESC